MNIKGVNAAITFVILQSTKYAIVILCYSLTSTEYKNIYADCQKKHRSSPQAALIKDLNPVIRGWTSYYINSDAQTIGELAKQDHLTYLKLRRWAKRRCGNINDGHIKYWTTQDGNNWVFATRSGEANPLRLLLHKE